MGTHDKKKCLILPASPAANDDTEQVPAKRKWANLTLVVSSVAIVSLGVFIRYWTSGDLDDDTVQAISLSFGLCASLFAVALWTSGKAQPNRPDFDENVGSKHPESFLNPRHFSDRLKDPWDIG